MTNFDSRDEFPPAASGELDGGLFGRKNREREADLSSMGATEMADEAERIEMRMRRIVLREATDRCDYRRRREWLDLAARSLGLGIVGAITVAFLRGKAFPVGGQLLGGGLSVLLWFLSNGLWRAAGSHDA